MPITTEFWATTAQVIPALLLAFVLANHPKELKKRPITAFYFLYSTAVLLSIALAVVSEFLALDGLLGGGGRGTARVVIIAIGVLAFWVVLVLALWSGVRFIPDEDPDFDNMDLKALGRAGAWLAAVAGYALFAIVVALLPLAAAIWLAIRV